MYIIYTLTTVNVGGNCTFSKINTLEKKKSELDSNSICSIYLEGVCYIIIPVKYLTNLIPDIYGNSGDITCFFFFYIKQFIKLN